MEDSLCALIQNRQNNHYLQRCSFQDVAYNQEKTEAEENKTFPPSKGRLIK